MTWFLLAAIGVALAMLHLARLTVPPRVDLAAGVGRWDRDRLRASRTATTANVGRSPLDRIASRLTEAVARRVRDQAGLSQDLAVTDTTLEAHLSKALVLVLVALVGPPVIFGVLAVAGVAIPLSWGLVLGVALAVGIAAIAHRELRSEATRLRAEFRRSLSMYLDLVAMSLEAGRGHAEALPAAARIGSGWTFQALADAVDGARFSGITAWEALGQLGHRYGLPELVDLEGALRLANDDGAKVKATLIARSATLRSARVAYAEAEANQATESMKFALIVMVFAFLFYELYPSVVRLFAG
jgi:Flp pilus assembly protein TadB